MRVAIISSPRSGNSWIRSVIRDALDLKEIAVHNYKQISFIPDRCVLQIHWYREPNFQEFLKENRFKVITIARHPLDILISALHFMRFEPQTAHWLCGNCELPNNLLKYSPASDEFLLYALSFGSENLLSVTYQWWHDHDAIKLRYEDLVADTSREIKGLAGQLNVLEEDLSHSIDLNSFEKFRMMPNRHGWQGRAGLWRELIPTTHALEIYAHHQRVFEALGYAVEQNTLTRKAADERWGSLAQ